VTDELRRRAWPKLLGLVTVLETSHPEPSIISTSKDAKDGFLFVEKTFPQPTTPSSVQPSYGDDQNSIQSSDNDSHVALTDWGESSFVDNPHAKNLPSVEEGSTFGDGTSPRNNTKSTRGQPLNVFFRNVASKSQALNLSRDDMSVSSSTTASVSNMTAGTNKSRRYSLPILASSLDFRQVELDTARCTWHLLTGDQRIQRLQMEHKRNRKVARLIRRKQRRLANLINYALVQSYPLTSPHKMRYYQGFHDVACIFMSVLGGGTAQRNLARGGIPQDMHELAVAMGLDLPSQVLVQVSQSHLCDFLKSDFTELQTAIDLTIFPLIAKLDPELYNCLCSAGMQPFFALSWILTWFSHEVRETALVKRLFDVFLVSHPLMPIYLSVAMVLHPTNRQVIFSSDHDFGSLHQTLRNLTKNSSMTGWRYKPGDGYVSDSELDGEEEDAEQDSMVLEQAGIDGDIVKIKTELQDEAGKSREDHAATSSVSTCGDSVSEGHARVPFQELIDLALEIMNRVPPRKLLPLAVRCYGGPHVAALLARSPNIRLFADPQPWAVRSLATADWVFQQRARHGKEATRTTQHHGFVDDIEDPKPLQEVLVEKRKSPAVVALGFGEGDDRLKRKRRRNRMIAVAIGVGLLAVAIAVSTKQYTLDTKMYSSETAVTSCDGTAGDFQSSDSSSMSSTTASNKNEIASPLLATATASSKVDHVSPSLRLLPAESTAEPFAYLSTTTSGVDEQSDAGKMKHDPRKIILNAVKNLPTLAKRLAGKIRMKNSVQEL